MIKKLFLKLAFALLVIIIAKKLNGVVTKEETNHFTDIDQEKEFPEQDSQVEIRVSPVEQVLPDDLTVISGIGPKISTTLVEAGISSYAQLADSQEESIEGILKEAGLRLGDTSSWIQQAKELS